MTILEIIFQFLDTFSPFTLSRNTPKKTRSTLQIIWIVFFLLVIGYLVLMQLAGS